MDLQELYERTNIDLNLLRYCLDRGLLPGLKVATAEHKSGRPREFGKDTAFAIVCAARLLQGGLPPRHVRSFMGRLLEIEIGEPGAGKPILSVVLERRLAAVARLGDGVFVRLVVPSLGFDSDWIAPEWVRSTPMRYVPAVEVVLDLEQALYELVPALV